MSGTISGRVYTEVVNGNFRDKVDAQLSATQTSQGFIAGTVEASETEQSLDFTGITTPGLLVIQHLEDVGGANSEEIYVGIDVGGFQPALRVEPGDTQLTRLVSGETYQIRRVSTNVTSVTQTIVWRLYEK